METNKEHPVSELFEGLLPTKVEETPVGKSEPEEVVAEAPNTEEEKPEVEEEPKEKIPYHQRPRFKKLENEIAELKAKLAESSKVVQPVATIDPDAQYLVGNDPKAVEVLNKMLEKGIELNQRKLEEQRLAEEANMVKSVASFKELADQKAQEWEEATGIKFTDGDKNPDFKQIKKLLETGNLLTETKNEYGHRLPDLDRAFAIWQAIRETTPQPETKVNPSKEIAKKMSGSGVASKSPKPALLSRDQVRRMGLTQFIKSQR